MRTLLYALTEKLVSATDEMDAGVCLAAGEED